MKQLFVFFFILKFQICSSSFVGDEWIKSTYGESSSHLWPMDVRRVISAHAQFLRSFCTNTKIGISYVLQKILSSALVSDEVLPLPLVEIQVQIQAEAVRSAGKWQISVLTTFMRLTMSSSHIMTGLGTNAFLFVQSNESLTATVGITAYQRDHNSANCYCLTTNNCPVPGFMYSSEELPSFGQYNLEDVSYGSTPIKGIEVGCFGLESVLSSNLECYYDRNCFQLLVEHPERFSQLNSSPTDTFPPNTSISSLLDQLMVDQWLVNMSYSDYYSECLPDTCSYSYNQKNHFLIILTSIIALIGGLNTLLRLVIPFLIQIFDKIKTKKSTPVRTVWIEEMTTNPSTLR